MERDQLADILHRTQDQQEDDILRLQQHMELQLKQQLQQQYRQVCWQVEKEKQTNKTRVQWSLVPSIFFTFLPFRKYMKGVKKSVISVCKKTQKGCQRYSMAVKKSRKRSGFVIYSCLEDSAFTAVKKDAVVLNYVCESGTIYH